MSRSIAVAVLSAVAAGAMRSPAVARGAVSNWALARISNRQRQAF